MEFSYAVADIDKIEGWEKKRQDEHQIGARFGACMWVCTKAVLSPRPEDMNNITHTLHSIAEAINKTWEVFYVSHGWLQQASIELQECKNLKLKSLQYDIEVPCFMQWELIQYSARSYLNEVLIKIGALKKCFEKAIIKAMETVFTTPYGKRLAPWTVFLETQTALMVHCMQGWALRLDRHMKGWCLGGQPDLSRILMMDQILTMRTSLSRQWNFVCFFVTPAGIGENVSLPLWMSPAPWSSSWTTLDSMCFHGSGFR